jgi:hypothetical protein
MKEQFGGKPIDEHDWHSREYVNHWIQSDITRDAERRPILRRMLAVAPFPPKRPSEFWMLGPATERSASRCFAHSRVRI